MTAHWYLDDASCSERVGAALARALGGGMVITLEGDLGVGKTTLVRGVLRACGWTGGVKSPTYSLVEYYPFSSLYLYHFDFYRFADPSEWETAGLSDYFRSDSACLVEWPERVAGLLPTPDVRLVLAHLPQAAGRSLAVLSGSAEGDRCAAQIATLGLPAVR